MRSLNETDNTDAASSDYPYRKVRDTLGAVDGTKLWDRIFSDLLQGIQKLIRLVGNIPNDLPDNETNGYQILDALELLGQPRVFQATSIGGTVFLISGMETLLVGKMYRFITDKNLLPGDILVDNDGEDYEIKFQNCSYILSNQVFNIYILPAKKVIVTTVGAVGDFKGILIDRIFDNEFSPIFDIYKNKGKYYLTRTDNIKVYDDYGRFISGDSFGGTGSLNGKFNGARGISVVNDKTYVADAGDASGAVGRIQAFDSNGNYLFKFGLSELDTPSVIRGSELNSKIYVIDSVLTNKVFAYNAVDGLYSFTITRTETILDIGIFDEFLYLLFDNGAFGTEIKKYNAENGAFLSSGNNQFTLAEAVNKFYGINENYFILKSGSDVVLVDRNYNNRVSGDEYRDILKTIIYDYDYATGNISDSELYLIDNSKVVDDFAIKKFI